MNYYVWEGDTLETLQFMESDSKDSIVTDPPYGLGNEPDPVEVMADWVKQGYHLVKNKGGFMGKSWDAFVPQPLVFKEAFRVLKPGGYALVACGTRTADWMAMSMRFGGFEIRDVITWHYGSGFPKSHDVSKGIDKKNGKHEIDLQPFGDYIKKSRELKGYTKGQLDEIMGTSTAVSWWEGRKVGVQLPSKAMYEKLKAVINLDNRFDYLIDWAEAEREILGKSNTGASEFMGTKLAGKGNGGGNEILKYNITAPATDEAKKWEGWGTALKPATEFWILGRKPLSEGTVAANVIKHGTGGINIDGSRIGTAEDMNPNDFNDSKRKSPKFSGKFNNGEIGQYRNQIGKTPNGRWPANVIFDEFTGELLDQQSGISQSNGHFPRSKQTLGDGIKYGKSKPFEQEEIHLNDIGGASRFFYCAKASQSERNAGLDEFEDSYKAQSNQAQAELLRGNTEFKTHEGRNIGSNKIQAVKNNHPTVKPLNLMRYLVRLITPPGGTCLDLYAGSGTTICGCVLEGVNGEGIEQDSHSVAIANGRIEHYKQLKSKT